ncbi:hypothetical protein K8R30_00990 [archaeon]|nr:hypothetical protein [archaeon]
MEFFPHYIERIIWERGASRNSDVEKFLCDSQEYRWRKLSHKERYMSIRELYDKCELPREELTDAEKERAVFLDR